MAIGLAKAGGVRLEWLLTGEGPRDIDPSAPAARRVPAYPARDQAKAAAEVAGIHAEAVRRVMDYLYPDPVEASRISVREWLRMMWKQQEDIDEKLKDFQSALPIRLPSVQALNQPALPKPSVHL